jgi:hypothetical protein
MSFESLCEFLFARVRSMFSFSRPQRVVGIWDAVALLIDKLRRATTQEATDFYSKVALEANSDALIVNCIQGLVPSLRSRLPVQRSRELALKAHALRVLERFTSLADKFVSLVSRARESESLRAGVDQMSASILRVCRLAEFANIGAPLVQRAQALVLADATVACPICGAPEIESTSELVFSNPQQFMCAQRHLSPRCVRSWIPVPETSTGVVQLGCVVCDSRCFSPQADDLELEFIELWSCVYASHWAYDVHSETELTPLCVMCNHFLSPERRQ